MPGAERDVINRLKRIEGQVRALQQMIEEREGCEKILTQLISARAALDGTAATIVVAHIAECFERLPPDQAQREITRAVQLLSRIG